MVKFIIYWSEFKYEGMNMLNEIFVIFLFNLKKIVEFYVINYFYLLEEIWVCIGRFVEFIINN